MVKKYSELYLDARKALLASDDMYAANMARELLCAASGKTPESLKKHACMTVLMRVPMPVDSATLPASMTKSRIFFSMISFCVSAECDSRLLRRGMGSSRGV